jgi:hypothetical protein
MPRNPPPRQPEGPSLPPEEARIQLERSLKRANELLQEQPLTEQRFEVWRMNAWEVLKAAFGKEHGHLHTFIGQRGISLGGEPEHYLEAERRKRLKRKIGFLEALIEEFKTVDAQTQSTISDFFDDFDADIRRVSEQLFRDGHCADSVSAAFRELNQAAKRSLNFPANSYWTNLPTSFAALKA